MKYSYVFLSVWLIALFKICEGKLRKTSCYLFAPEYPQFDDATPPITTQTIKYYILYNQFIMFIFIWFHDT